MLTLVHSLVINVVKPLCDLAENLESPLLVATLETQKHRLIHGNGPALLVVDEYQMIADDDRGLNYELAIALAPPQTQLLLLSGSVANPQEIVKWFARLGRTALIGVGVVLGIGLVAFAYHAGQKELPGEVPLIAAEPGPVKVAPALAVTVLVA